MPQPGDLVPHPDGPPAVRMVDPTECGNGHPWVPGDMAWSRRFWNCTCTDERGHWTWWHDCGWELTVPPHAPTHKRQVY